MFQRMVFLASALAVICLNRGEVQADDTWVYAVQIHAEVKEEPPSIALTWKRDIWGAKTYTIYRKDKEETSWGSPIAQLDGEATTFTDTKVEVGRAYEYQIYKVAKLGYTGYGYIYAGIRAPLVDQRGRLLLVVESGAAQALSSEIERLRTDLTGDGWDVEQRNVSASDTPAQVRAQIYDAHRSGSTGLDTVFLLGHVPVLQSGSLDWDTHGERPTPADAFYGDMIGDWPTGDNSPSYMPVDIQLKVGRVDFYDLPGKGSYTPWPSEWEMLRNYLEKNHKWRHAKMPVPRRALMGNARGDEGGGSAAATGYRNFDPLVGPDAIVEADVSYNAPFDKRWISILGREQFLLAYGCGGGAPNGCGGLGTNVVGGVPGYMYSRDVMANDPKAVFVMMFGSWFGQWDLQDNLLRTFLASPSMTLAACMAGRPHWFIHHMGLGETIGYSTRLSMNNSQLYRNYSNAFPRAVYVAVMGDPTLRLDPVPAPSNLQARPVAGAVNLKWQPAVEPMAGYHVYRALQASGPYTRVTSEPVSGSEFTDSSAATGDYVYLVRAIKLQETPSGTYYNPSQGIFASVSVVAKPPEINVVAEAGQSGIALSWNSTPGTTYRVLAAENSEGPWTDLSGPIPGRSESTSWIDTNGYAGLVRFYRVVTP